MKFEEALQAMREGKKVKRESVYLEYCVSADGTNCAMRVVDCDTIPNWGWAAFTGDDIMADDWQIVAER